MNYLGKLSNFSPKLNELEPKYYSSFYSKKKGEDIISNKFKNFI